MTSVSVLLPPHPLPRQCGRFVEAVTHQRYKNDYLFIFLRVFEHISNLVIPLVLSVLSLLSLSYLVSIDVYSSCPCVVKFATCSVKAAAALWVIRGSSRFFRLQHSDTNQTLYSISPPPLCTWWGWLSWHGVVKHLYIGSLAKFTRYPIPWACWSRPKSSHYIECLLKWSLQRRRANISMTVLRQ